VKKQTQNDQIGESKPKSVALPDTLNKASKKGCVTFSEDELKKVSGGVQKVREAAN